MYATIIAVTQYCQCYFTFAVVIDLSTFLNYVFFRIGIYCVFIMLIICNYGFTLVVLYLYAVTIKDTFALRLIFVIS